MFFHQRKVKTHIMITVGASVVWSNWSGIVRRIATYGGKKAAHIDWDGVLVPDSYASGIPGPNNPYPHVPVDELHVRTPQPDDEQKKLARIAAVEAYKASHRLRFASVQPGAPVTWSVPAQQLCAASVPGALEHFKGKFVRIDGDYAIVEENRFGLTMHAKLMDVQLL
jgi:hypothetical protein